MPGRWSRSPPRECRPAALLRRHHQEGTARCGAGNLLHRGSAGIVAQQDVGADHGLHLAKVTLALRILTVVTLSAASLAAVILASMTMAVIEGAHTS